jgi:hypothetical protein
VSIVLLVAGCESSAAANVTPLPAATPHTAAASAVLRAANVPAGLAQCPGSGAINSYLAQLNGSNPALGATVAAQWLALKSAGAQDAAIAIFAADPAACTSELGASDAIRSAASFVVSFADEGEADRAWQSGVLGFAPPAPGEAAPGLVRGTATGLGSSSFTYGRSPVQLGCWRKGMFVAIVAFSNLDSASFKTATAAVDAHLN